MEASYRFDICDNFFISNFVCCNELIADFANLSIQNLSDGFTTKHYQSLTGTTLPYTNGCLIHTK